MLAGWIGALHESHTKHTFKDAFRSLYNIPLAVSRYLKGLAGKLARPSAAQRATKFDKHEKKNPLIYLRKLLRSITMDFNIAATQNTAGVWVPCYAVRPQTNLPECQFCMDCEF